MSQRTLFHGILSLALLLGSAAVADAQSNRGMRHGHDHAPGQNRNAPGPPLTDVYFMVLDLRADQRVGDLRPGQTWTMAPGETLRFRTAGRAGGSPERYPATRFNVVSHREHVKVEASNQEVGNVTVTATQPSHVRGERTEIRYEIVDRGMDVRPNLRTGSFFIEVEEGHHGDDHHDQGGDFDDVSEALVIYEHQDFRGDRAAFGVGEVRDLNRSRFSPDTASSIQLAPGCRVTLYEHPNFQGRSVELTDDENDLRRVRMNDNLSSFDVDCTGNRRAERRRGSAEPRRDPGRVTLYEHQNFQGRSETFFEGEIADMNDTRLGADVASSVRIDGNCRIALYEHPRFDGQSTILSRDEEDLRRHRMNDNLSSFRIECGRDGF